MNIKVYQTFYNPKQYKVLDPAFIPFNNIANEHPELYEHPLFIKLHEKHINFRGHWGMVSWRWKEKTNVTGDKFIRWMKENPGYDMYHIAPHSDAIGYFNNTFTQGEVHHPGIINYTNKLLEAFGYRMNIKDIVFPLNIMSTCLYYIGNAKFWDNWLSYIDTCLEISKRDQSMHDFLYVEKSFHRENWVINYPFVIERLVSLFLYFNPQIKVKHFPHQWLMNKTHKQLEETGLGKKALLIPENTIY